MKITERIYELKRNEIKTSGCAPEFLYLADKEFHELMCEVHQYILGDPYKGTMMFNGMTIVLVATDSHLNVG